MQLLVREPFVDSSSRLKVEIGIVVSDKSNFSKKNRTNPNAILDSFF